MSNQALVTENRRFFCRQCKEFGPVREKGDAIVCAVCELAICTWEPVPKKEMVPTSAQRAVLGICLGVMFAKSEICLRTVCEVVGLEIPPVELAKSMADLKPLVMEVEREMRP